MKQKKIFLILFCLLCTTGCDVTYQVQFEKDKIIESNTFYLPNEQIKDGDIKETLIQLSIPYVDNSDFLIAPKTKVIKETDRTGYSTVKEYDYDNYNTIGTCYDAFNVIKNKNSVMISTSANFRCFEYYKELDQFKIVAKVNYKVSKTNADEKKGNTYIWYINKDNAENKPIQLFFDLNQKKGNWPFTNFQTCVIVIALIIVIVMSIVFFVSRISKKNNKI